jgi:hypothetical protein
MSAAVIHGNGDNIAVPMSTRHACIAAIHRSHRGDNLVFGIKHATLFVGELDDP